MDVVVVTKDRPKQLKGCIRRIRREIPCNNIVVVDSSVKPDRQLLQDLGVTAIYTPEATLGYARQQGLLASKLDRVVFLDDDVTITRDWYSRMLYALENNGAKVVAVSSKIVFGYQTDPILEKLYKRANRAEGGSVGVVMLKRNRILAVGGFNPLVHRGEDTELHLRLKSHGVKWIRDHAAVAYHHCTFKQYMERARNNGLCFTLIWKTTRFRLSFIARRLGSALLMPIYYGLLTLDPRVAAYYFMFRITTILTFLRTVKNNMRRNMFV